MTDDQLRQHFFIYRTCYVNDRWVAAQTGKHSWMVWCKKQLIEFLTGKAKTSVCDEHEALAEAIQDELERHDR